MSRSHVIPAPRAKLVRRALDRRIGTVIAKRYQITRAIGMGGMGVVYDAVDLQTGVVVAIKALHDGAHAASRLQRFRREASSATAVQSELVCRVHYLGVESGTPFIVMERLHGQTLRESIRRHGPLSLGEAVGIMLQLLDALTATHEAGIIHRDVKPSNVFLVSSRHEPPRIKLIDFGLAKRLRRDRTAPTEDDKCDVTPADGVAGTLAYLTPEHLLGVGDLDERVDVYAAGIMFFELLTGKRAYQEASFEETVREILLGEPLRPTDVRRTIPAVFDDVVGMATARARERRFSTAKAFRRALVAAWRQPAPVLQSGICPALRRGDDDDDDDDDDDTPTMRRRW